MSGAAAVAVGLLPVLVLVVLIGFRRPLWMLAAYAVVVPWGSAFRLPIGLPPSFSSVSTLLGVAASAALLAHIAVARHRAGWVHPSSGVAVMLLGTAALTLAWSVAPAATVEELLVLVSLVALFLAASAMDPRAVDLDLLERAIVAGGAIVGVYAVWLLATGDLPSDGVIPRFEVVGGGGENGDPNITAASVLLPLFIAASRGVRRRGWSRLLHAVLAVGMVVAVVTTVSRGGLIAMVLGLTAIAVVQVGRRGLVLVIVPVLIAAAALSLAPQETREHIIKPGSSGRTGVWSIGLTACADHCAIGSGYGTFPDVHEDVLLRSPEATGNRLRYVAHNIWLQAAVETGVVGVGLLVALFATTTWALRDVPRRRATPALAGLLGLALTNTFLSNLDFKYFWLVLLYAVVVAVHARSELTPWALDGSHDGRSSHPRDDPAPTDPPTDEAVPMPPHPRRPTAMTP